MIRRKKGAYEWLEFELLQDYPQVVHGIFTHKGDLCFTREESVRLAGDLLSTDKMIGAEQEHGKRIEPLPPQNPCDGLYTEERGVGLLIRHADCQAAIFFDPVHERIGAVHSGWRGSACNIYQEMIQIFRDLGSKPEDLIVCISPSLGPENAEFIHYRKELPKAFFPFMGEDNHFDFWKISEMQLSQAGIAEQNIEVARICTYSTPEDFFSYRRDTKTGRNATVVALGKK